jgi:hypothetical protein
MKEFRLAAWPPQLRPPFDRIAYRRMLSDMSHRYVSLQRLVEASGARRQEVRQFLEMLASENLLIERKVSEPESLFGSLRQFAWFRRGFADTRADLG